MPDTLTFAHVTDLHLTEHAGGGGGPRSLGEALFARVVARFNAWDALDFVLITGDVLDTASEAEVDRFRALVAGLEKPWHFIPGNHDGFYDPETPQALPPAEAVARLDPRLVGQDPHPQRAHWSRPVAAGVQLVGLDSRVGDDWNGVIDDVQMRWLRRELEAHDDDLVLLAVHHPLHNLTPLNRRGWWSNFVLDNGPEVEALLDQYSNVGLVLSGHHHANHIVQRGNGRLQVVTAPLGSYPCVWREIRLQRHGTTWAARVETHSPADEGTLKRAYDLLLAGKTASRYSPGHPEAWAAFVEGRPEDRTFEGLLA